MFCKERNVRGNYNRPGIDSQNHGVSKTGLYRTLYMYLIMWKCIVMLINNTNYNYEMPQYLYKFLSITTFPS